MSIIDGALQFSGTAGIAGSTDSPTTGTQFSTNVIDLLNARDMGIGKPLMALVEVLTAFTGGTSLQVGLQHSSDNSTFTTALLGPVVAEANLVADAFLLSADLPRPSPLLPFPRYWRLIYVSVGTHGAGALFGALVLNRPDQMVTTSGAPTVYPAGQTVAN